MFESTIEKAREDSELKLMNQNKYLSFQKPDFLLMHS